MLKRIFADNFRALVNFELRPGHLSLLLGGNGSGKTSIFDVLGNLRDLIILGRPASELFAYTRTRWDTREVQRFELDIQGDEGTYHYALEVQHPLENLGKPFIRSEQVGLDGDLLYRFSAGEVQLFRDDRSSGPLFPFLSEQSFLPNLDPSVAKMSRLAGFKSFITKLWRIQPNPFAIEPSAKQDDVFLARYGTNFASFYSYLNSERPEARTELEERLRDALPGFRNFFFRRAGEVKLLLSAFSIEEKPAADFLLSELSEGQRVLAVLYAAVCGLVLPGAMLYFDEPDNFVALSEIQPWLQVLRDALEARGAQAMIISHHPEVMDYLAQDSLWWFERPSGPVIARPYEADSESPLRLSELVARGVA